MLLLLLCALVALEAAEQLIALDDSSISPEPAAAAGADATDAAVKLEADENAEKAQAVSAETQAGNATVKMNNDTCQMRQATIQLKVDDAEKKLDAEGLKYMRLVSGVKMYLSHIASGEADRHGVVQAKAAYPAKYHRLAYENAQRRLGRSPAKEMTEKIKIKVADGKKNIKKLNAQLDELKSQVSNTSSRVNVLSAKMTVVKDKIRENEQHLEIETQSHKQAFDLELKTLGDTNARRKHHMEKAEKARAAKIAKEQKALRVKVSAATAQLTRLQPELLVAKSKATQMAKRREQVIASNKQKVALLSQSVKVATANVEKELAEKAKNGIASAKERTTKNHLEREQKRISTGVLDEKSELQTKYEKKQESIRKSREMMTMKAKNAALHDEIKHVDQESALRVAQLKFERVQEKSQAAKDGLAAIEDYKKAKEKAQTDKEKAKIDTVQAALDKEDDSKQLKAELRTLTVDMKTGATPTDYYQRTDMSKPGKALERENLDKEYSDAGDQLSQRGAAATDASAAVSAAGQKADAVAAAP